MSVCYFASFFIAVQCSSFAMEAVSVKQSSNESASYGVAEKMYNAARLNGASETALEKIGTLLLEQEQRRNNDQVPRELFGFVSDELSKNSLNEVVAVLAALGSFEQEDLRSTILSYFVQRSLRKYSAQRLCEKAAGVTALSGLKEECARQERFQLKKLFDRSCPEFFPGLLKNIRTHILVNLGEIFDEPINCFLYNTSPKSTTIPINNSSLCSFSLSPDEAMMATCSRTFDFGSRVEFWDLDGKRLFLMDLESFFVFFSWSPSGNQCFIASGLVMVQILDIKKEFGELSFPLALELSIEQAPPTKKIHTAVWSPDGQFIATAWYDGYVRVWSVQTGTLIGSFQDYNVCRSNFTRSGNGIAWSPDSAHYVFAQGEYMRIQNTKGICVRRLIFGDTCSSVEWSSDGKKILLGGFSFAPQLYVVESHQWMSLYEGRNDPCAASFSPDGKKVATFRNKDDWCKVNLWDTQDGTKCGVIYLSPCWCLDSFVWLPDSAMFALAKREAVEIWNVRGQHMVSLVDPAVVLMRCSSDSSKLFTMKDTLDERGVKMWSLDFKTIEQEIAALSLEQVLLLIDIYIHCITHAQDTQVAVQICKQARESLAQFPPYIRQKLESSIPKKRDGCCSLL